MGKKKPTLKQLQNTASDLNNYMNMISSGEYKNPIEINDNIKHLSDEIVQMVSVEIYKQDKNHLSKGSIAVIELLNIKFGDLKDNPELDLDKGEDTISNKAPVQNTNNIEDSKNTKQNPGKTVFGHKSGTAAALLDELLIKGVTQENSTREILKKFPDASKGYAKVRIKDHVRHLEKKGIVITFNQETKIYKTKEEIK